MNKSKDSEVNAIDVGRHFLAKYYNTIAHDIDQVVHFYSESSNVKRFGKPAVNGLENIKTELNKHRMNSVNVRIFNTVCLNSLNDSIIIQVSGEFVQKNGSGREFIQNVVLASQGPGKYYIYSDSIEWLSDLFPSLGLSKMNISDFSPRYESLLKDEPFASEDLKPRQNGQYQPTSHDQDQPQQIGSHQSGARVHNIQSFIKQTMAAIKNPEPQKSEHHDQFKTLSFPEHAPKSEAIKPTPSLSQPKPAPSVQIPPMADIGPRTWAKLVSGQIKSNGLPPPTQPPPATVEPLQAMDKKIKTQQEFQQVRGDKREGGNKRGDGSRPHRQRRGTDGGGNNSNNRPFRRDLDSNRGEGGGGSSRGKGSTGKRGGQNNGGDRPPRRNNNQQQQANKIDT